MKPFAPLKNGGEKTTGDKINDAADDLKQGLKRRRMM
jgi:hypothetical protein